MRKINFYERKYDALESFYQWVDYGSSYDLAVDQANYYSILQDDIDEILLNVTIATRFERSSRDISESFKEHLRRLVPLAKTIDWKECGLTDDELEYFEEDLAAAESFIRADKPYTDK